MGSNFPELSQDVHIWKILFTDFNDNTDIYTKVLSNDEILRADRFYFKIDRKRYIITRAVLKILLTRIMDVAPQKIILENRENGKPYLKKPLLKIYFNITHSANIGLIALTDIGDIGIDVELFRENFSTEKIARRFFSATEVEDFLNLPDKNKSLGFFNCWTRKEAFIKALGLGLKLPLKKFDVTLTPQEKAKIKEIRLPDENAGDWLLQNIGMPENYSAALAIKAKSAKIQYWIADETIFSGFY